MSPTITDDNREHVIVQSAGLSVLMDKDTLRSVDQDTAKELIEETLTAWQERIAGAAPADDRMTATAVADD